jgi:hypothetical protein
VGLLEESCLKKKQRNEDKAYKRKCRTEENTENAKIKTGNKGGEGKNDVYQYILGKQDE